MSELQDRLRALPQVGALLEDERLAPLVAGRRSLWMTPVIQEVIAVFRRELQHDKGLPASREELHEAVVARVMSRREQLLGPSWTRVINGTGVVVHTNLGRSNFPEAAARAAHQVALHNSDLEYDLPAGVRGHRGRRVEEKAALLAGARDALIVNNNAAAVWLAVRFLSQGGPVIISRGEIVAIGGSFRIHEILSETGCQLVEVGTTNRTSLDDYRKAMVPGATVLKVHRSNFTVEGFTEEVDLPELAQLCRQQSCPLIYDAGSGALYPYTLLGLPDDERLLAEDVAAGADLVTCSGDKLLGGCQAGMILGSKEHVAGLRKHPMRRAFRVDKTTLAALDAVFSLYLAAEDVPEVPTLRQLGADLPTLQDRAERLLAMMSSKAPAGWRGDVVSGRSSVGGGSFSSTRLESRLVMWTGPKGELENCHRNLRLGDPALVGRMNQDGLGVDVRTIGEEELELTVEAFARAWTAMSGPGDSPGSGPAGAQLVDQGDDGK